MASIYEFDTMETTYDATMVTEYVQELILDGVEYTLDQVYHVQFSLQNFDLSSFVPVLTTPAIVDIEMTEDYADGVADLAECVSAQQKESDDLDAEFVFV
jgi:hypothetical protein